MGRAYGKASAEPAQRGFSLLEVLIAMVVLSIGLLGLAALQSFGLRGSHGANLVSQASVLAYDMADRIRANPNERTTYDGFVSDCPDPVPAAPLASADLAEWSCAIEALLPAGAGRITRTINGAVSLYVITVEWRDAQVAEGADPWEFALRVEL